MQPISTIRDIYKTLGGIEAIAYWLKTCRSSVGMWVTNGRVSSGHQIQVYLTLKDRGHRTINPALFDFEDWGSAIMPKLRRRRTVSKIKRAA